MDNTLAYRISGETISDSIYNKDEIDDIIEENRKIEDDKIEGVREYADNLSQENKKYVRELINNTRYIVNLELNEKYNSVMFWIRALSITTIILTVALIVVATR